MPGVTWEQVWQRRVPGELLAVPTHFAGLEDLIAMKEAAARPEKDVPDLKRLRRLLDRRKRDG